VESSGVRVRVRLLASNSRRRTMASSSARVLATLLGFLLVAVATAPAAADAARSLRAADVPAAAGARAVFVSCPS
jgi:hypothetical protein